MKIAILSMQRIVNFGSVLQAWSLRQMIGKATGVQAEFLDIENTPALTVNRSVTEAADYAAPACYSRNLFQRGKRWFIRRLSAWNKRKIRSFMKCELGVDARNSEKRYDHVVIGSDEMFNHAKGLRLHTHGEVPQARRLISYAASCGSALVQDIAQKDVERVRQAMRHFSAISVRDAGTERYVSALYEGPVVRHMDPVLMGDLYKRPAKRVWLKRYLLVYAYGQRIRTQQEIAAIRSFAAAKKLKTVAVGGSQFWCDLYLPLSPMRMLDWFAHADYVVTDTFHGAIFSVINKRKFAVLIRPSNENKLTSLLESLGLSQRSVTDMTLLQDVLERPIDYEAVDVLLARERLRAQTYLKEQLTNEQGTYQPGSGD